MTKTITQNLLKEQLNKLDQLLQKESADNNISEIFNHIKGQIILSPQIKKHYIKEDILFVEMSININQFYQWLSNNNSSYCIYVRKLWYKLLDYLNDIFSYGYHFSNITNINQFLGSNNNPVSLLDGIISDLPYNIFSAADIYKPKIADDKNDFNFIIIAKAADKNTEIDEDVINDITILTYDENNDEDDEEIDNENEENDEEIKVETKEEEMRRLIDDYKNGGECHAQIAYNVMKENQNQLDDITFIKSMELIPRVIKHSQDNNIISLLWSISKTQFVNTFSIFRKNDTEQVWKDFKKDFQINYNQYTCINKKFMNEYLTSINQQLDHIISDIVDIDISRENNLKFKSIIQVI